jgi:integrase/recombinase XerD
MSELRKQMIRDMQLRNFSPTTLRGYLRAVAELAQYYHRSPDTIGPEEIQDYIVYLLSKRKLAVGSCYGVITALRFFYTVTLKQDGASVPIPQVKRVTRLPEILSPEQPVGLPCGMPKMKATPKSPNSYSSTKQRNNKP